MSLEDVYEDFQFLAKRHNRTPEFSEDLASQFFLEYLEGDYSLPRLSPQYRGFVKKRCMREWTKNSRRRDGLQRFLVHLKLMGNQDIFVSEELSALLESDRGVLVKLLIEGYDRREIAENMQRSVGWVQKEIQRLLAEPEMRVILLRNRRIVR